jgi:hypothetical protein
MKEEESSMKVARFVKPLTVAFDQAVFEEIKRITDTEQISMGEWVRYAVNTALKIHQQKGEPCNEQ